MNLNAIWNKAENILEMMQLMHFNIIIDKIKGTSSSCALMLNKITIRFKTNLYFDGILQHWHQKQLELKNKAMIIKCKADADNKDVWENRAANGLEENCWSNKVNIVWY